MATTEAMVHFLVKEWEPSLCIVDGNSPLFQMTKPLREKNPPQKLGLIILTKESDLNKEELAFRYGADHYLAEPQQYPRLRWRIVNVLNRIAGGGQKIHQRMSLGAFNSDKQELVFLDIRLFPNDFLAKRGDEVISLSPIQFRLLYAFFSHIDALLSREWLQSVVWGNTKISPRSIDAQVSKLKKVIPEIDASLMNIYGKGYILTQAQKLKEESAA
ncbi:MAG: response regulator transcription factor [Pseudobdellovibrionaceae bacterium]|nr:MAG: response regulator transcription factor [Pseudobdellovibrionaceae bacterium]